MHFGLFIVTLERFGDVPYKRYIDLFCTSAAAVLPWTQTPSRVVISVDPIPMTAALFILVPSPVPQTYREIRSTTVYADPMQVSRPYFYTQT